MQKKKPQPPHSSSASSPWDADLTTPTTISSRDHFLQPYASLGRSSGSVRLLLTLSNLSLLKTTLISSLISQFETSFSLLLTDESTIIRDALSQIDAQLFEEYTRLATSQIRNLVRNGVSDSQIITQPVTEVRPYIYNCLLLLVDVHSEVTTTSPSLTNTIVSYLLERLCEALLDSFRALKRFTLPMLLQATLDVEFVTQTLAQYTTGKASELQQAIYVELDRGSDNETRNRLQRELGELKNVLSTLRKGSRAEFLCFRVKGSTTQPSASRRD